MTIYRHGFVLGKFMPPHRGHLFMCEAAARMVERLTVLVCSIDAEPLPGELRARWMQEMLPQCRIVHMHREIPQTPEDHPRFWDIWRAAILEHHSETIDLVFGSEPYVLRLADELQARAIVLDPEREIFPCSGTAVRDDPAGHWADLPAPARRFYQRRLCLLGAESSGKSTLAAHLAARLQSPYMSEYGRCYDALYRRGQGWTKADFCQLAATHRAMRDALVPDAGPLLVEDTDAVQTLVWSQMLGSRAELGELDPLFEPPDLYLLLDPGVPWHDDGTRYHDAEPERRRFHDLCKATLETLDLPHVIINGGDWKTRTAAAERHADKLVGLVAKPGLALQPQGLGPHA